MGRSAKLFGVAMMMATLAPAIASAAGAPAARIGDLVTSALGGPPATIDPPGSTTVLVCGKPAARVGDGALLMILGVGPAPVPRPVVIAAGSRTVRIAGRSAARLGDPLTGGQIATGCGTVLIGT